MNQTQKPHLFTYRLTQFLAFFLAVFLFHRHIRRNEIRGKKGPFLVIANHECALDFVNLIGLTGTPMNFVVGYCIYSQLPFRGLVNRLGVIPKQQFQTKLSDLRTMKNVISEGRPLVLYPAGIMCEDGLTTPIPQATAKFVKWLGVDVYAARSTGSYLVMPKWAKGLRPGRTEIDVYKLIDKEQLATMTEPEVQDSIESALLFDAYREQEAEGRPNRRFGNIEGLEYVLYQCPHCGACGTVIGQKDTLRCTACGFTERSDKNAILHKTDGPGDELPYVSDWSTLIRERTRREILGGTLTELEARTSVSELDPRRRKFVSAGEGTLLFTRGKCRFTGVLHGEPADFTVPLKMAPTIPFKPGRSIELQLGDTVYRCFFENKFLMPKAVNMVELFHELEMSELNKR